MNFKKSPIGSAPFSSTTIPADTQPDKCADCNPLASNPACPPHQDKAKWFNANGQRRRGPAPNPNRLQKVNSIRKKLGKDCPKRSLAPSVNKSYLFVSN